MPASLTPALTVTSFCGVPRSKASSELDLLSGLLRLGEQSWNAKGPEDPYFSPDDFHSVASGLEQGTVPLGVAPSINAPSSPWLLGTLGAEVHSLCSTAQLLTQWVWGHSFLEMTVDCANCLLSLRPTPAQMT